MVMMDILDLRLLATTTILQMLVFIASVYIVSLQKNIMAIDLFDFSFPVVGSALFFTLIQGATGEEFGWRGYSQRANLHSELNNNSVGIGAYMIIKGFFEIENKNTTIYDGLHEFCTNEHMNEEYLLASVKRRRSKLIRILQDILHVWTRM